MTNGLTQSLPQKVFIAGPMFRYERPQKGRYRQFHQIDIEVIGTAEPLADAEVIACGWDILQALGVAGETVLEINTLGDKDKPRRLSRRAGRLFHPAPATRCRRTAWTRLERNPLRILDSKDEGDRRIVANAPIIAGHLTEAAAAFYASVRTWLDRFGVPFRENPRIVRGLDYYGHTAFEFVTSKLGVAGHGDGRRALRRAGGGDGRAADAGGRLGGRHRAAGHAAGRTAAGRRAGRRGADRRGGGSGGARTSCRRCAPPACAPRWRIAAMCAAAWSAPTGSARAPR